MKKQTEEEKLLKKVVIEIFYAHQLKGEDVFGAINKIVVLIHRQKEELLEEITKKVGEEFGIDIREIFNQLKDEEK